MNARVAIFNGKFDPLTLAQAVEAVFAFIASGRRGWLCTVNVAGLMSMRTDARLQAFVDRAALVVADGQPLIWCARLFHGRLPARVAGVDMVDALCARAAMERERVFLLGAAADVIAQCADNLRSRHPGLQLDYADGYFGCGDEEIARRIRASGARLLLVGMGMPRQEYFVEEQWERLGVSVAIGVGGSFDVWAGRRFRASPLLQSLGMEWLVRLLQEPRRLFARYLVSNTRFCWLVLRQLSSSCLGFRGGLR